jgi:hypothetical protein
MILIKSKRMWMRNATCMSDYREVQHGFEILNSYFSDETKKNSFILALDSCCPGAALEGINLFNRWWRDIKIGTYITSLSEHDDTEDINGRLSMWRAFGSGTTARVGIVFRIPDFSQAVLALNLIFSPVAYLTESEAHNAMREAIENINANCGYLRSVDSRTIPFIVFQMLLSPVTCLKHEGFREEREWRAIFYPTLHRSLLMESSTEVVAGIPQTVFNIPMDVTVDPVLAELDFARMFDRLIIGPSSYPWVMYEAFVAALEKAGCPQPSERVFISNIPIRD